MTPSENPFRTPPSAGEPTPEQLLKALGSNVVQIVTLNLAFAGCLKSLSKKLNKYFGVPVPELTYWQWLSLAYSIRATGTHLTHQTKLVDAQENLDKALVRRALVSYLESRKTMPDWGGVRVSTGSTNTSGTTTFKGWGDPSAK